MAERGHHDTVSDDSWAAMEYSKIRWMYDQLDIGDRTEIEFHNGGHTMQKQGPFDFCTNISTGPCRNSLRGCCLDVRPPPAA